MSGNGQALSGGTVAALERVPPHSLESEKAVLGGILLDPDRFDEVALLLQVEDFYHDAHQVIFHHMRQLYEQGKRIDQTLLVDRIKAAGQFDDVGGYPYLAELVQTVTSAANIEFYAKEVQEKAILRALIRAGTDIVRDAYQGRGDDSREVLARAEERIFAIHDRRWAGEVTPIDLVLQETFTRIDARLHNNEGVFTGFTDLDNLTGGLHPGELVILAARPSMGKTALALNIADHVAVNLKETTLVVSLEMSSLELGQRLLCARGRINGNKFRSNFLSAGDQQKIVEAANELSQAPLFVDDTPSRSVTEIAAAARRVKRKHGLGLIVIDYLQLIQPDNPSDPRQEQVAKMARRLKATARELKVPILCLAQLNRQAELSKDNRPRLSHLRESGAIEQDADVVMFIHREEYYLSREEREQREDLRGRAELIVAKQRNGPTGEVDLLWHPEFLRFDSAATYGQEHYDEAEAPLPPPPDELEF